MSSTHRLELDDQTLREWDAVVLAAGPDGIVLDRSAFYPGGGGQPPDHGVLLRVPVELAADATGVVVTVNQLGLLVGVATFGTLYLNLAGQLPGHASPAALGAFRHVSAHAEALTLLALAGLAAVGVVLAAVHILERRRPSA